MAAPGCHVQGSHPLLIPLVKQSGVGHVVQKSVACVNPSIPDGEKERNLLIQIQSTLNISKYFILLN